MDTIVFLSNISHKDHFLLRKFYQSATFLDVRSIEELARTNLSAIQLVLFNLDGTGEAGLSLLAALRAQNAEIPVLALANQNQPKLLLQVMDHSIQGFLLLPISEEDFKERTSEFLSRPLQVGIAPESQPGDDANEWMRQMSLEELFFQGQTWMSQEKYAKAIQIFEYMHSLKSVRTDQEVIFQEKAFFETARCNMKMNKAKSAIEAFQRFVKACPRSNLIHEAWFFMGEIFYKAGNSKNALVCYQKAISLPSLDNRGIVNQAKRMVKKIQEIGAQ